MLALQKTVCHRMWRPCSRSPSIPIWY